MNEKLEKAARKYAAQFDDFKDINSVESLQGAAISDFKSGYTHHANTVNPILKRALRIERSELSHLEIIPSYQRTNNQRSRISDLQSSISAITELLKNQP